MFLHKTCLDQKELWFSGFQSKETRRNTQTKFQASATVNRVFLSLEHATALEATMNLTCKGNLFTFNVNIAVCIASSNSKSSLYLKVYRNTKNQIILRSQITRKKSFVCYKLECQSTLYTYSHAPTAFLRMFFHSDGSFPSQWLSKRSKHPV